MSLTFMGTERVGSDWGAGKSKGVYTASDDIASHI